MAVRASYLRYMEEGYVSDVRQEQKGVSQGMDRVSQRNTTTASEWPQLSENIIFFLTKTFSIFMRKRGCVCLIFNSESVCFLLS